MADIQVIKLKVRRGLDSQRRLVILDEGELGYTIDTQRLYVGTGVLSGGIPAAPKIHSILTDVHSVSNIKAEQGDVVYAGNKLYQYNTSNTWQFIGAQVDDGTIVYDVDNQLSVSTNSINGLYLNQSALSSESISFTSDRLVVNYDTNQFAISGSKFALNANAIKPIHIDSNTISRGLTGGNGSALSALVDGVSIGFDTANRLTVIGTPISAVSYSKLLCGFEVNPSTNQVSTIVRGVDPSYFALSSGIVTVTGGVTSSVSELAAPTIDHGIIQSIASSIYDILSCDANGEPYNGSPNQVANHYTPSSARTTISGVVSADINGVTTSLTLSSAGFIVFEGNSNNTGLSARNNNKHIPGRFAIPVFTF